MILSWETIAAGIGCWTRPTHTGQNIIMIKMQVQIPDVLFRQAKRLAVENETNFAELVP